MLTPPPPPLPLNAVPPDRQGRLDQLQLIQSALLRLQDGYTSNAGEFWALRLAWEAVRHAWYVVAGDEVTSADKLASVKGAIKDCE